MSLRSEFEKYNDDGDIVGISKKGHDFLSQAASDQDGYVQGYSNNASEDYKYDIQDDWNISFHLN